MKYILPFLLLLTSCSGQARQTQMRVADAVANGVNETKHAIVEQYTVDLRACRSQAAGSGAIYVMCAAQVEENWAPVKDAWRRIRRMHDAYATALEQGESEQSIVAYSELMGRAWCELSSAAKDVVKLPAVPGLVCEK